MRSNQFGGLWTEQKLAALVNYLHAYLTIFNSNPSAKKFTRHYVDAFAGSGWRTPNINSENQSQLQLSFFEESDFEKLGDAIEWAEGSVRKVLSMENEFTFHKYWLVEKDTTNANLLGSMIYRDYPDKANNCDVINCDANVFFRNGVKA